ncbi:LysR family transcriptional regulator [Zobellella aerophila]|uniref:LysR family transcriptional regulator n=1 Tax=Zobellella aerophila TaxID=870480 RepID=UPI0031E5D164
MSVLNQQWLTTFLALAETGHFTRTAEKLFMTQPGVSQHIHKLEQQIGEPLLNRIGKGFELTRAGSLLVEYGRKMQRQEAALLTAIRHDDEYTGPCRIACSGSLAMLFYPLFLKRQRQYPTLRVMLEAAPNKRIIEGLQQDTIDLGIVTQAGGASELAEIPLGAQPLCLVLPAGHVTDRETALNFESLRQLGFINHPDGHHYAEQLLGRNFGDRFRGMDAIPQHGYVNQLNQILLPVSLGLGFTVLPEIAVRLYADKQSVYCVQPASPVEEHLFLVHKRYRPLSARYQWFVDCIREQLVDPSSR